MEDRIKQMETELNDLIDNKIKELASKLNLKEDTLDDLKNAIKKTTSNKLNNLEDKINIDGFNYIIKPIKFDLSKLDEDGRCDDYCNKSYVMKSDEEIKVRMIDHFNDDNNRRNAFDPYNYNKDNIFLVLSHGDDFWELDNVYEIISTDNTTGIIKTSWCEEILPDLIEKSK